MLNVVFVLIAIVVGWALNHWSHVYYYNREQRERRLGIYQQAYARLQQLQDSLPRAASFTAIQPQLDDFKQWCYQNNLYLDSQTEAALIAVFNSIVSNMLPTPVAANLLLVQQVANAFEGANNAIRAATGRRLVANPPGQRWNLMRYYLVSNMTTYYAFGFLAIWAFMVSTKKSMPVISNGVTCTMVVDFGEWLIVWALIIVGIIAVAWFLFLLFTILKRSFLERIAEERLQRIIRWNDVFYFPALITAFAASFASILARLINAGVVEPVFLLVYALGILVMVGFLVARFRVH